MAPKLDKATISLFEEPMPTVLHSDDKKPIPVATPDAREAELVALRARVAALEAALRVFGSYDHNEDCAGRYDEHGDVPDEDEQDDLCDCSVAEAARALRGGTSALDAVVSAAVAARVAAIRARVEALPTETRSAVSVLGQEYARWTTVDLDKVLSAIGATEGGAP